MRDRQYPATVVEILDDQMTFSSDLLQAVQGFAESKPWEGSTQSRKEKFRQLNRDLGTACSIQEPTLLFGQLNGDSSGASSYSPKHHRITMTGKLSVVTFLHEFAHALGHDEQQACRWSINLFRKCFPRQYACLIHVGHMLVRPQELGQRINPKSRKKTIQSGEME